MSAWICCYSDGKAAAKIVPPRLRTPSWTGLGAESEEKREPASDIEAAVVDSLKVLDPERPIREATEVLRCCEMTDGRQGDIALAYSITSSAVGRMRAT